MASNVARCEPPEKHRHLRWHWLIRAGYGHVPARWYPEYRMWNFPGSSLGMYDDTAWNFGYRYIAPAIPPEPERRAMATDPPR